MQRDGRQIDIDIQKPNVNVRKSIRRANWKGVSNASSGKPPQVRGISGFQHFDNVSGCYKYALTQRKCSAAEESRSSACLIAHRKDCVENCCAHKNYLVTLNVVSVTAPYLKEYQTFKLGRLAVQRVGRKQLPKSLALVTKQMLAEIFFSPAPQISEFVVLTILAIMPRIDS